MMRRPRVILTLIVSTLLWGAPPLMAATINAASCQLAAVQSAIASAAPGDTVVIPNGTCSWSGSVSITGIRLQGQTQGGVTLNTATVNLTKHATQVTQLSNLRFPGTGLHFSVGGGAGGRPYIIDHNYFEFGSSLHTISANGGLLHHNTFQILASGVTTDLFHIVTSEDWSQAATFGTNDVSGERNIYFEDNTFINMNQVAVDSDTGARTVFRHNLFQDSALVFHGGSPSDSSTGGGHRQIEIYDNVFSRVDQNGNLDKWIWVRGGTGVICNNQIDAQGSSQFPHTQEIRLTLCCPSAYPVQYQVGQWTAARENPPTHPLAIYGNTAGPHSNGPASSDFIMVAGADTQACTCANPGNFIQQGRDYVLSQTWTYAPYPYPHPLQAGGSVKPPGAPANLQLTLGP